MEQMQFDEAGASAVKKQAGQSGIDGNIHRRNRRVEIRFSNEEREELAHRAIDAGYTNLAQYLREAVMKPETEPADRDAQAWLQNINRIGNYIAEIAGRLNEGEQPDDEILLAVVQVQEYAEDVWKTVKQGRATGKA
jgi:t-SNARE complex subunit (syntaxin)